MANSDLILAPGESSVVGQRFSTSIILFWLKTQTAMTNRRIAWKAPNTIFGTIPLGYAEHSMPVGAIASVTVNIKPQIGRGIVGVLLLFISVALFSGGGGAVVVGLFMLLFAVAFLANMVSAALVVTNNGGGFQTVNVSVLEKDKLEQFARSVNEILYSGGAGGGYGANPHQAPGTGYGVTGAPAPGHGTNPSQPTFHPSANQGIPPISGSQGGYPYGPRQ